MHCFDANFMVFGAKMTHLNPVAMVTMNTSHHVSSQMEVTYQSAHKIGQI